MDPSVLAALQQMGLPAPPVPQVPGAPAAPMPAQPTVPVPPAPPVAPGAPGAPQGPLVEPAPPPEMPVPVAPGGPAGPPPDGGPMAPPTFAPPMPGGPGMGGVPAPVQGGPPTPGAPGAPQGPPPEDPQVQAEAELARQDSSEDDTLGTGSRPRRGHSLEHPLDMASAQIGSELRANAPRLAADLFPNGPAGSVRPAKEALNAYVRRHWDDADFRAVMLNRMAPKGPDGNRVPWGVKNFLKLYEDAVAPYRLPNSINGPAMPAGMEPPAFQPPGQPPQLPPPGGEDVGMPPPPGLNQLGV